ncbi:MAG: glycosyltransferase family 9 protein [Oligoflexales bacterium]|nr:glycosyltransferase family 9 protein [Oligoflexales bacterium]
MLVNANCSDLCYHRNWPLGNYAKLIKQISIHYPGIKIILLGANEDILQVNNLVAMVGDGANIVNLAGKTSIRELLVLIEKTALMISNDSGPAQFTAGYQTQSIVLFGPETPVLYKPANKKTTVFYKSLYCSPCLNVYHNKGFDFCNENRCMKEIGVEEVFKCVEERLESIYRKYFATR